jgi:predicted transcriptional regulator
MKREIAQHMRRFAPDCTYADIAISLGVSEAQVKEWTRGVRPAVESKVREWRSVVGVLAERLRELGLSYPQIAELAGISRQHLVTCRREAQELGTVQP